MSFDVAAEAYDRFMGRYSRLLSPQMADLGAVAPGQRVLDVGCGPGALTAELVRRVGPEQVTAVDPSEPFVHAARERFPGLDVRRGTAEALPFDDNAFDAAIAQLVVHFMTDPVAGIREMARVTRPGGVVAACVWDHAHGTGPVSLFWEAVARVEPDAENEAGLAGSAPGDLVEILGAAGLRDVEGSVVVADLEHASFEGWWEPYTLGVGPAGKYIKHADPTRVEAIRDVARELTGPPPFTIEARAWAARGMV
ncbi:MAG TPA: class I SAM-dependent methyltransferase [Candidatus Limnocylindrales bacterium]|nr:class I SAM-dependent methyltransferase [Candidatus Limnocylindrales bacterium]